MLHNKQTVPDLETRSHWMATFPLFFFGVATSRPIKERLEAKKDRFSHVLFLCRRLIFPCLTLSCSLSESTRRIREVNFTGNHVLLHVQAAL